MRRSLPFLGCLAATAFASVPAAAHEQWADGEPIPAWVKEECCGVSDAHHLRDDQVHPTGDGYKVDGYNVVIPETRLEPSPDGEWWVFYRTYPGGVQSIVYCFFGPIRGS